MYLGENDVCGVDIHIDIPTGPAKTIYLTAVKIDHYDFEMLHGQIDSVRLG